MGYTARTELSHREELFCSAYAADPNGSKACIAAGYSKAGAGVQATRMLKNPKIKGRISELLTKTQETCAVTAESLVLKAGEVMARCMQGEPVKDRDGNPIGEWRFDAANAIKAQELQAKLLGLFRDTGTKGNPLHVLTSAIPDFDED